MYIQINILRRTIELNDKRERFRSQINREICGESLIIKKVKQKEIFAVVCVDPRSIAVFDSIRCGVRWLTNQSRTTEWPLRVQG